MRKISWLAAWLSVFAIVQRSQAQCMSIPERQLTAAVHFADFFKIKNFDDNNYIPLQFKKTKNLPDSLLWYLERYEPAEDRFRAIIDSGFLYLYDYSFVEAKKLGVLGSRVKKDSSRKQTIEFGYYYFEQGADGQFASTSFTPLLQPYYEFFDENRLVGVKDSLGTFYLSAAGERKALPSVPVLAVKKLHPFVRRHALLQDLTNRFYLQYLNSANEIEFEFSSADSIKCNSNNTIFIRESANKVHLWTLAAQEPYETITKNSFEGGYNFNEGSRYAFLKTTTDWVAVDRHGKSTELVIAAADTLPSPQTFRNDSAVFLLQKELQSGKFQAVILNLTSINTIQRDTIVSDVALSPYLYLGPHKFVLSRVVANKIQFVYYEKELEQNILAEVEGDFADWKMVSVPGTRTGSLLIFKKGPGRNAAVLSLETGKKIALDIQSINDTFQNYWFSHSNRFLMVSRINKERTELCSAFDLAVTVCNSKLDTVVRDFPGVIYSFMKDLCKNELYYFKQLGPAGMKVVSYRADKCRVQRPPSQRTASQRTTNTKTPNSR